MQFSCAQCSTKYAVPDEKVRGKRIRTKCRKCGAEIVVDGPGVPHPGPKPPASASGAPPEAARVASPSAPREEEKWTVAIDRSTQRKMTTSELAEAYARGEIVDTTLVWKQGMAAWQAPFEIPAITLALRAKGLEKGRAPSARGAAPTVPSKGASSASPEWDDENESTRVVDGALAFPGRPAPAARPAPARPAPVPASPAPASSGFEEDEATRVVAPKEAQDLLAPASAKARPQGPSGPAKPPTPPKAIFKTQIGLAAPPAPVRPRPAPTPPPRTLPVPEAPPPAPPPVAAKPNVVTPAPITPRAPLSAPSSPSSMNFDDEATAVIAPDRARELLENEAAKTDKEAAETPMGFGFDDEATRVSQERPVPVPAAGPKPNAAPRAASAPQPAAPSASLATTKKEFPKEAPTAKPEPVGPGPSIVLTEKKSEPPMPAALDPALAKAPPSGRDLSTLAHEKTRVVPRAKKQSSGTLFWITLTIALAAAAIGGFVASRLVDGQKLPSWMHLP